VNDYTDFSQFVHVLHDAGVQFIIVGGVAGTIAELEVLLDEQESG
jgi:hypothetical protein